MERQAGSGDNLMFLISQPRSGSTLLQHMLAGHPRIHTAPEPWLMLHYLYANRPEGVAAEYDARTAHQALTTFLGSIGSGTDSFLESVRSGAGYLYGEALKSTTADLFLDKTPRYYFIAEELRAVFPRARMIFLIRNPLAVFSSILHTHAAGDWTRLRRLDRMHDLVTAPRRILGAIDALGEWRTAVVRYEELISGSDQALSALSTRIEIEDVPNLAKYVAAEAALGDQTTAKHSTPVSRYADRWKNNLDSPAKRDVARSYLMELGPELIRRLGYDYEELMGGLRVKARPARDSRWAILVTPDEELPWWDRIRLGFVHSRQQRGLVKTMARFAYIVVRGQAWGGKDRDDHIDRRPV